MSVVGAPSLDADWLQAKLRDAWLKPVEAARRAMADETAKCCAGASSLAASLGLRVTSGEDADASGLVAACTNMESKFEQALDAAIGRCVQLETENEHMRLQMTQLVVAAGMGSANLSVDGFGSANQLDDTAAPSDIVRTSSPSSLEHSQAASRSLSIPPLLTVVTPGQASAFARALVEQDEAEDSDDDDDENNDDADGKDGDSSEYGSVNSFASATLLRRVGSDNRIDTDGLPAGEDTEEYIAAVEVINKYDYAVATHQGDVPIEPVIKAAAVKKKKENTKGGGSAVHDRTSEEVHDDDIDDEEEEEEGEQDDDDDDDDDDTSGADDTSDDEDSDIFVPRKRLPAPAPLNQSFSLWSILRQSMGKDLSRISMPATINQPLSILQRTCEDLEYLHLLYDAIDRPAGVERMTALAGFCISSYACWYARPQKPFSPTLGETYDWTSPDGRVRVLVEQLVYDPPVAAWHVVGCSPGGVPFTMTGELAGVSKFWGKYVEVLVQGALHMQLPRTGETYSWTKAAMNVHNVISGRIWIDMVGEVKVVAHATGETANFRLVRAGKAEKRGKIEGEICDAQGVRAFIISGNTATEVFARPDPEYPKLSGDALPSGAEDSGSVSGLFRWNSADAETVPLFRPNGLAEDAARQYGFTAFAITLNELTPEMLQNLPPTDSRLRPDMRALEEGNGEKASTLNPKPYTLNPTP